MITPAEIVWGLTLTLMLAAWRIAVVLLRAEDAADRPAWVKVCDHPGCVITADHKHGLTVRQQLVAEATRTQTLIWYAAQVLDGAQAA